MIELTREIQIAWRRFLATPEGRDGMLYLHESTPGVYKGEPHEVQFDAGFAQGHKHCISKIESIIDLTERRNVKIDLD